MQAAIETLRIALENVTNNEPIHRKEGNTDQADMCLRQATELRAGMAVLEAIAEGIKTAIRARQAAPSFAAAFQEIFDGVFKAKGGAVSPSAAPDQDCPHAAPFRYCAECVTSPCPIGLGPTAGLRAAQEAPPQS